MEDNTDPLFLLIVLPAIPIMLTLGKMIRWEDYVLRIWRKHSPKIGLLKFLFGRKSALLVTVKLAVLLEQSLSLNTFYALVLKMKVSMYVGVDG